MKAFHASFNIGICAEETSEAHAAGSTGLGQWRSPGLVNYVPALAYHICLALPSAFTQPGVRHLAEP